MEKEITNKLHSYGLQEYLSLGYIYLIILGIVDDVIYYKFLGINILNYSAISDVLMSPVNTLLYDVRVLVLVLIAVWITYLLYFKAFPHFHHSSREKAWYKKMVKDVEKVDEKYRDFQENKKIPFMLVFIACVFLGLRVGNGHKTKQSIEKGNHKASHTILFNDNVTKRVRILGQNSAYIFYLVEGQKRVITMPISGNVKEIVPVVD
ncbi:hypothetical protein [Runella sp.]|uniref:hypothetical protein n=1 Tax=Runella sp. TaxID=1960881 RepID=UPI003D14066C